MIQKYTHLTVNYGRDIPLEIHLRTLDGTEGFAELIRILKHECGGRVTGRQEGMDELEYKVTFPDGMLIATHDPHFGSRLIARIPERVALAEEIARVLDSKLNAKSA